jgi:hypothetical protein
MMLRRFRAPIARQMQQKRHVRDLAGIKELLGPNQHDDRLVALSNLQRDDREMLRTWLLRVENRVFHCEERLDKIDRNMDWVFLWFALLSVGVALK